MIRHYISVIVVCPTEANHYQNFLEVKNCSCLSASLLSEHLEIKLPSCVSLYPLYPFSCHFNLKFKIVEQILRSPLAESELALFLPFCPLWKILRYDSKPYQSHKGLLLEEFIVSTTCERTYLLYNKVIQCFFIAIKQPSLSIHV